MLEMDKLTSISHSIALQIFKIRRKYITNRQREDVIDADWDNLIILDGCRYDFFQELDHDHDGKMKPVISKSSNTPEFFSENFNDPPYPETVYISANPQLQKQDMSDIFHDVVRLWESAWNEELQTVHPSDVRDATINANVEFPNKRLIIHFIQPHFPFIGETGQSIEHGTVVRSEDGSRKIKTVWDKIANGSIEKELARCAYRENLLLAMNEVNKLLKKLPGKTVVTSDHGNGFGEYGVYGHPPNVYTDELTKVPWFSVQKNKRKKITSGNISTDTDSSSVEEKLSDLGYI